MWKIDHSFMKFEPDIQKANSFYFLGVIALGVCLRLIDIDAPLVSDELTNVSIWAKMPFQKIISNYQYPNNHIFLSLILNLVLKVFGVDDIALRLPVLVCGILSLIIAYMTALRITRNPIASLGTSFLLAISSSHIYYSTNARGYMLLMVFSQIILYRALAWIHHESGQQSPAPVKNSLCSVDIFCLALCLLGTWTVPTFVLFEISLGVYFGYYVLLGFKRGKVNKLNIQILIVLFICLCGFYIQYFVLISKDMLKLGMSNTFAEGNRLIDLIPDMSREWVHPWPFLLVGVLALFGAVLVFRESRAYFYLLATIVIAPLIVVVFIKSAGIISAVPHVRVFVYMQPIIFTFIALGGYFVAERAGSLLVPRQWITGLLFIIVVSPFIFTTVDDLRYNLYPERQGREPYDKVLQYIKKLGPQDLILASNKVHVGFYLYGAEEMRRRVESIIDIQQLGDVYFLVYTQNGISDMQRVSRDGVDYFNFLDFTYITEHGEQNKGLLIPATLFVKVAQFDNFQFYKVNPQNIKAGSKLKTSEDMNSWRTVLPISLEDFKTSTGIQPAIHFNNAVFLVSRNLIKPKNGFFSLSINLLSSNVNFDNAILYLHASIKNDRIFLNKSWLEFTGRPIEDELGTELEDQRRHDR